MSAEKIVKSIKAALGSDTQNFKILIAELINDDNEYYAAIFSFKPKSAESDEFKIAGGEHHMAFAVEGDDVTLIYGEDTQVEVSALNIYKMLYWCEVTEEVTNEVH